MLFRRLLWRAAIVLPTVASTLTATPLATPTLAVAPACQFSSPAGGPNPITHVIHLQFDNVHFTRDNPNVPSDHTYRYEGRAVLEDLEDAALTPSAREERSRLTELGRVLKQINAPVGIFGQAAIQVSTTVIRSNDRVYTALSNALQAVVAQRDRVAGQIEAQLTASLACSSARPPAAMSSASQVGRDRAEHPASGTVNSLREQAADVLETIKMLGRSRRES